MIVQTCGNCKHRVKRSDEYPCNGCTHNAVDMFEPFTNIDRIRNMSEAKLIKFLQDGVFDLPEKMCARCHAKDNCPGTAVICNKVMKEWLNSTEW